MLTKTDYQRFTGYSKFNKVNLNRFIDKFCKRAKVA